MLIRYIYIMITILFLITGCNLNPNFTPDTHNEPYNLAHFKQSVIVNDEGSIVTFSTIYGHQKRQGSVVWDDNFFRGFINKRTGEKTFQVYNVIYYSGNGRGDWRHYKQANYTVLNGQQMTSTQMLKQREDCSALGLYGKCVYSEHVAFNMNESLLQTIAQNERSAAQWMYHLVPQRGEFYPDGLFAGEAAGLLSRMAEYRVENTSETRTLSVPYMLKHPSAIPEPIEIPASQLPPARHIPNGRSVF